LGTVSVGAGDTVIVGSDGAIWSATNARAGDDIVVLGHTVIMQDVLDTGHLAIDPWPYDAVPAGTPYKIVQRSPLRYGLGQVAADVSRLVATLNTEGLPVIVPATATAPDPSLGEENQFAIQPSAFKLWLKTAGAWVFQGIYKGFNVRGPWDAVTNFGVNDVVSQDGSSYVAIAPNTNQVPPNAAFWMVLAAKGDPGPQGLPGTPGTNGTNGAGYGGSSATSLTIGAGSKTFTGVATTLAYQVSNYIRASSAANGANFQEGFVTAYGGGSLTINVTKTGGAGSFNDWNFALAGAPGAGDLSSINNLSELANKDAALTNLHGVNYNAAQTLTPAQKKQAQANLFVAPTMTVLNSGTAATYTTPTGCTRIRVRMAGGGGGGCNGGTVPTIVSGTAGAATTFGTSLLTANGGAGGQIGTPPAGGTASLGSGPIGVAYQGSSGGGWDANNSVSIFLTGGFGGNGPFGGAGVGSPNGAGTNAVPNTGSGGGGGGTNGTPASAYGGAGGAAGGNVDAIINAPAATYTYTVGHGGAGAAAGASGFAGGDGAAGYIIIEEYYGS
jgi:hypothetical protein